ncbi:MAG: anthranilate phosphoribosyltransferase [Azospirillum sp.]|nr:anthranilate phosphoribosyltransferase [Azospirillum sp.]MCA3268286.1 anthranilate phosphoribosyltransferase [Azospirillum sp.]
MPGDMTQLKALIARAADGHALTQPEAEQAFDIMMSGNATPAQMGAFLMALRVRGETVDEIAAAARTMRAKSLKVTAPADAVEAVGTGGDASGSFNISTAASFVVAGAGRKVAKHGNRAFSSKSGAADVLTALGVNVECDLKLVEYAISKAGVGFMMAPRFHSAMRHVAGVRVEVGTRTIFNLLGPLSNPAGIKRQLIGVFARKWIVPLAETLGRLGSERAWVAHGSDGLDEITTTGPTHVAELRDGKVREFEVTPEDAGLARARPEDLKGGTPQENAAAMRALLDGKTGPLRDVVALNAAAVLVVAGAAADLKQGVAQAAASIDSGAAKRALDALVEISNRSAA